MPENLEGAVHVVNKYQPVYETCEGLDHSQFASFDYDGRYDNRDAYASREAVMMSRSDPIDISTLDGCSQPKGLPRKQLFGDNGWLGKAPEAKEVPVLNRRKSKIFKGFGKKIKQHVEDIVSRCRSICSRSKSINRSFQAVDVARSHPFTNGLNSSKIVEEAAIPVTLDPVAQAKLYSEMEAMICISANNFLVEQYREGRLSSESIKKATDSWVSKKRLRVAEFQFDQSTQRRLILSNLRTMDFHGESSTNPVLLDSNLRNWKAITKEMSGRTFCLPDSVIRKHINEIRRILNMLGAPLPTFLAFKELQVDTLSQMQEGVVKHQRHSGSSGVSSVRSIGHIAVADRAGL